MLVGQAVEAAILKLRRDAASLDDLPARRRGLPQVGAMLLGQPLTPTLSIRRRVPATTRLRRRTGHPRTKTLTVGNASATSCPLRLPARLPGAVVAATVWEANHQLRAAPGLTPAGKGGRSPVRYQRRRQMDGAHLTSATG